MRLLLSLSLGLAACAPPSVHPPEESAALSSRSACEDQLVLAWVNDPATTSLDLRAAGVYARGANRIIGTRDAGVVFATVAEIDAIPYVGAGSMAALYDAVDASGCSLPCEQQAVISLVNEPSTSVSMLAAIGVYRRGASALVAARDAGASLVSIPEIDAVPYIGPRSLDALRVWGEGTCVSDGVAEVVFSPQYYSDSHLVRTQERIAEATTSLDVAMYSFSDEGLFDAIEAAVDRGVSVRLVLHGASSDRRDPVGTRSERLEAMGADVRWVNKTMHHKYVIIDGPRHSVASLADAVLISGSANWSYGAGTIYDENTSFVEGDDKLILSFQREFDHMWSHSREFDAGLSPATDTSTLTITDAMIDDAPGSEAVFTSANFRVYESSRYGWTFAARSGESAVADRLVALIEDATTSIDIASGHMRSKAISDALLLKHATEPDVAIRVYLDGQEWISSWWQAHQLDELADCLATATTDLQRTRCEEVGRYFSKDLADAGIDVRFDYYAYRWNYRYAEQMHHKYVLIDGETVFSGSYNFSSNAEKDSFENAILWQADAYPDLVADFYTNFDSLWSTGAGTYEGLLDEVVHGVDPVEMVWAPMSLSWSEVDVLKTAVRDACIDEDDDLHRDEPWNHQTCARP